LGKSLCDLSEKKQKLEDRNKMGDKVVRSALVIIPPEQYWQTIQQIRKVHDKVCLS
jgi:hypothetical protein